MTTVIIIILSCIAVASWVYSIYLYKKNYSIIALNEEAIKQNEQLELQVDAKKTELAQLHESVLAQGNILQSLKLTSEGIKNSAEQRAQEYFNHQMESLQVEYDRASKELKEKEDKEREKFQLEIAREQEKLLDLQSKQKAYNQAMERQEAIAANKDLYRLAIDETSLGDIEMLREIQPRFVKKEIIDKVIWETYYKPAYDALVGRTISSSDKVCGIYKITDMTTGASYIGQSVDCKERWRQHIKASLAFGGATNKLYQAMMKTGQYNFSFEVLEEVSKAKLNERETYWIEFYDTKNHGLNSTKGNN